MDKYPVNDVLFGLCMLIKIMVSSAQSLCLELHNLFLISCLNANNKYIRCEFLQSFRLD